MAQGNFAACNAVTRKWEGGYSDHPSDPGGKTMNGVTEATFWAWLRSQGKPTRPVRTITEAETDAIYKSGFWDPIGGDSLAMGVDLATYDSGVNSGVSRAKKWLAGARSNAPDTRVKEICAQRLSFMRSLRIWKTFGKGWLNRVTNIEALSVKWALQGMKVPAPVIKERMDINAKEAEKKAKANAQGAGGAGGGAVATGGAGAANPDQLAGYTLSAIIIIAVLVAGALIVRHIIHKKRAEAFAAVATENTGS